ncbi:hypothetical protein CRYUN_Cryun34aG0099000 [Craigia yunnanensis]
MTAIAHQESKATMKVTMERRPQKRLEPGKMNPSPLDMTISKESRSPTTMP